MPPGKGEIVCVWYNYETWKPHKPLYQCSSQAALCRNFNFKPKQLQFGIPFQNCNGSKIISTEAHACGILQLFLMKTVKEYFVFAVKYKSC